LPALDDKQNFQKEAQPEAKHNSLGFGHEKNSRNDAVSLKPATDDKIESTQRGLWPQPI